MSNPTKQPSLSCNPSRELIVGTHQYIELTKTLDSGIDQVFAVFFTAHISGDRNHLVCSSAGRVTFLGHLLQMIYVTASQHQPRAQRREMLGCCGANTRAGTWENNGKVNM